MHPSAMPMSARQDSTACSCCTGRLSLALARMVSTLELEYLPSPVVSRTSGLHPKTVMLLSPTAQKILSPLCATAMHSALLSEMPSTCSTSNAARTLPAAIR